MSHSDLLEDWRKKGEALEKIKKTDFWLFPMVLKLPLNNELEA